MPEIPAEALKATTDALMHHDMAVCGYTYFECNRESAESLAGVALAALAEHGYAIVPSTAPAAGSHPRDAHGRFTDQTPPQREAESGGEQ